ncbi:MAG TPA: hypothetical protein VGB06_07950 [Solirubrobacterales bacterium]|jgi:hypothetical protein
MKLKLKALGLGVLAAVAAGSIAAVNASATANGHFTSGTAHVLIKGTENTTHKVKLSVDGGTTFECDEASYTGTTNSTTVTELTITPTYHKCHTTGGVIFPKTMNGCDYVFYSQGTRVHGTVKIICPSGKAIEIHHPNCTITVGTSHALAGGVSYTNLTQQLTANFTVSEIPAEYHAGACIFLGTSHKATMTGSLTIAGTDTNGTSVEFVST